MGLKATKALHDARRLWRMACEHDKMPTDSLFVDFSKDNPYSAKYDKAVKEYLEFRAKVGIYHG